MKHVGFLLAPAKDVVSLQGLFTKALSLAVPRQPSNDLFEIFEIERGVSADEEAKDDPGRRRCIPVPRKELSICVFPLGCKIMGFLSLRKYRVGHQAHLGKLGDSSLLWYLTTRLIKSLEQK